MLFGTRFSRAVGNSRLSVKAFILLTLVGSPLPVLGLGLLVMPDFSSTACCRFARVGTFRYRGKGGRRANGAGGGY